MRKPLHRLQCEQRNRNCKPKTKGSGTNAPKDIMRDEQVSVIRLKSLEERLAGRASGAMSAAHPAKLTISHWKGLCSEAEHCPAHDNLQASGRLRG